MKYLTEQKLPSISFNHDVTSQKIMDINESFIFHHYLHFQLFFPDETELRKQPSRGEKVHLYVKFH